jgi:hypothetical protein
MMQNVKKKACCYEVGKKLHSLIFTFLIIMSVSIKITDPTKVMHTPKIINIRLYPGLCKKGAIEKEVMKFPKE